MKEGVDKASLALAKRLVVITKGLFELDMWDNVTGLRETAMESHRCRGYRSKTRSVPRPQDSSRGPPLI